MVFRPAAAALADAGAAFANISADVIAAKIVDLNIIPTPPLRPFGPPNADQRAAFPIYRRLEPIMTLILGQDRANILTSLKGLSHGCEKTFASDATDGANTADRSSAGAGRYDQSLAEIRRQVVWEIACGDHIVRLPKVHGGRPDRCTAVVRTERFGRIVKVTLAVQQGRRLCRKAIVLEIGPRRRFGGVRGNRHGRSKARSVRGPILGAMAAAADRGGKNRCQANERTRRGVRTSTSGTRTQNEHDLRLLTNATKPQRYVWNQNTRAVKKFLTPFRRRTPETGVDDALTLIGNAFMPRCTPDSRSQRHVKVCPPTSRIA